MPQRRRHTLRGHAAVAVSIHQRSLLALRMRATTSLARFSHYHTLHTRLLDTHYLHCAPDALPLTRTALQLHMAFSPPLPTPPAAFSRYLCRANDTAPTSMRAIRLAARCHTITLDGHAATWWRAIKSVWRTRWWADMAGKTNRRRDALQNTTSRGAILLVCSVKQLFKRSMDAFAVDGRDVVRGALLL